MRSTAGRAGESGRLTTPEHWEEAWASPPRWRLPSPLVVGTRNLQRLLRPKIQPGARVLELGCAPGKLLAWMAAELGADVAGLDASAQGIEWARELFRALGLRGDLRHEDAFTTTFGPGAFDLVCSWGLIEHFDDPRPLVRQHVTLARPGGRVLIGVPHYGGIYGTLQGWLDRDNLRLHNLGIMDPAQLAGLAPPDLSASVRAFPAGRLSPWLLSLDRKLPAPLARGASLTLNAVGLLQPADITGLCPLLVLEIERR